MKKLTYVLIISKHFPSYHFNKGQETHFIEKITDGKKIHTIRENYELWKKRAEKINSGQAVLSLRVWEGKPRRSKQIEILQLEKIGVQSIKITHEKIIIDKSIYKEIYNVPFNDGLSVYDFMDWFNGAFNQLNVIIHFTDFRY